MEISSNLNLNSVNGTATPPRTRTAALSDADGDQDQVTLTNSNALHKALDSAPASRPETVARARQLIADPTYPGADVTSKVSQFIADKLFSQND
jgi:hypothetical protein